MRNEAEEKLTLFFRHFLNTPEEIYAHLRFKGSYWRAPSFRRHKPQIAVHVGIWRQVHYEKGSEKDPQVLLRVSYKEQVTTSLEADVCTSGSLWTTKAIGAALNRI